ncbi:hypothetical protein [Segniliparus rugosus]|uniref:HNH endonuclease n=1 Tax=Segniliparus rugosus (strain ATCC BAA-974 / DSM 45345 / CCUG 50838 / CIP 108380 / JCM 13579 / CDC 945) TaxID=679197 RepID=E5XSL9_SEGRC|nr:hypothetical protein HMPREF9336_02491 [Segniliparus rugosus ATCC BAA-974]
MRTRHLQSGAKARAPDQPITLVVVDLAVLANLSDLPAWLAGAPIDPELAQKLAKASKTIRFTTTPDQYKPTTAIEVHVNTRDKHCRFPGCYRKSRTELDHSHPFDHEHPKSGGQTIPDDTITWTSPTGKEHATDPG